MKLPQTYEAVYRDNRRNPYRASTSAGVEPMFIKDLIKKGICKACGLLPGDCKKSCKSAVC